MEEEISIYSDEDLLVDYSKLFVGPFEIKSPPYGSVYIEKDRKVMGNSTMEVMELYREAGLAISNDFKELPDHIAVELEFMYYLVFKEIEAFEESEMDTVFNYIKMQQAFLDRFLRQWVAPFCEKIKEGTDNKFYLALADCVSAFIMNSAVPNDIHENLNKKSQGVLK
jgi:TorA maturation chaperone TorD